MLRFMAGLLLILAVTLPTSAQTTNPAGTPAGTISAAPGIPAKDQPNQADRTFFEQLAIGNTAEIELGHLAADKANAQPVKDFAQQMVHDHEAAAQRISDLARASALALPNGLDAEHRTVGEELRKLTGTRFDTTYAQAQVQDHQRTVQLLEYEIGSGQSKPLRDFAAETLPQIRMHLQMAQSLASRTSGNAAVIHPADVAPGTPSTSPQTPPISNAPGAGRR